MGSGQNVTIYPLNVGEATVMAQLPDSATVAKCTVIVEAGKSLVFETNSRKVQPFHSKVVNYTVSPVDAILTWTMAQEDDYFEYKDLGCDSEGNGQVEITGIKEGSGTLACVTDGGAKGSISVRVAWDYEFALKGSTTFTITPIETKTIEFTVNPTDADIHVDSTDKDTLFSYELTNNGDGIVTYASDNVNVATVDSETGLVTITGTGTATIKATVADGTNYTYATKTAQYTLTVTATTGIKAIDNGQSATDSTEDYYDLSGRRVSKPSKGVFIQNGKKVVIK